jgi:PAS domain S-box-containing protein
MDGLPLDAARRRELIFNSTRTFLSILGPDGRLLDCNDTPLEWIGVTRESVIGLPFWDTPWSRMGTEPDRRRLEEAVRRCAATGETVRYEVTLGEGGPAEVSFDFTISPIKNDRGEVIGMVPEARDITDRVRLSRALTAAHAVLEATHVELARSGERLQLVVEGSAAGIWDWNVITGEDWFSPQWCRLLGYEPHELEQRFETWADRIHPEDRDDVFAAVQAHLEHRVPYDREYRLRCRSGEYRWFRASGQAIWNERGEPQRMAGSIIDVTARRQAEEEIRANEQRFRRLADQSKVLIWQSDVSGACTWCNRAWLDFVGRTMDEESGDGWARGIHPDDAAECVGTYRGSFEFRRPFTLTSRFRRHDGEYRWLMITGGPVEDGAGEFTGFMGSCFDVTDRLQAEKRVRESLREKERLLREKDVLLREIHHRVKNNLSVVASLLYLKSASAPAGTAGVLRDCRERVLSMAAIHETLYQSHDLGRIRFDEHVRNLAERLRRTYALAPERIRLDLDLVPIEFDLDRALTCGMLLNELLANAFQHAFPDGRPGRVRVALAPASENRLSLVVADDGIGVSADREPSPAPKSVAGEALPEGAFGLKMARALARQLDAKLERIAGAAGFEVRLTMERADVPV